MEAATIDMLNDGVEDIYIQYLHMIYMNYVRNLIDFIDAILIYTIHFSNRILNYSIIFDFLL